MESDTDRIVRHARDYGEAIRIRRDAHLSIQRCRALKQRTIKQRDSLACQGPT